MNESTTCSDYSDLSKSLTKTIDKKTKKENGIYFTHPSTIQKNIELLENHFDFDSIDSILEPSFGSGEFIQGLIHHIKDKKTNINITGIELNKSIFDQVVNNHDLNYENIEYINDDFIQHQFSNKKYDLIIGNPPYFVIKKKNVSNEYINYFDGRPNIFVLFILKSINLLTENGILSFVLPRNFLNSLYFNKVRNLIYNDYTILNIFECDDNYIETKQKTIILIIQKRQKCLIDDVCLDENTNFATKYVHDIIVFGTPQNINQINTLLKDSTTLEQLGFTVYVGTIVWNQNKNILTNDSNQKRLVYSSDISNKELKLQKYSNEAKKNYIKTDKKGESGKVLVINRGYGVGTYKFEYCLIDNLKTEYFIENHLICVKYTGKDNQNEKVSIKKYEKVMKSFENNKTSEFISLYFGNNAINTTELCKILPIY